ncbi:MAG: peptide chain release factor 2 [Candidatus Marinimicrobia bacterium]|nr:peptide chain release factor 2 [Candidatus Neomarinimicrobiota bacterium]
MQDIDKEKANQLNQRLKELRGYLEISTKKNKLEELRDKTVQSDFWNNGDKAQSVLKKISLLEKSIKSVEIADRLNDDVKTLIELTGEAGGDELTAEFKEVLGELEKSVDDLEFKRMLGGKEDSNDAILSINPGAGGTESQDWAAMLLRMYERWAADSGFESTVLDFQPGDEAGIKSVTLEMKGDYAYGYLKAEAGVHRLVRLSPFDSANRRHTSFASVFVYPEVDEEIEIEIDPADLRIDTYRASGAGGQHVNKTDSAIRITHIPTGIVVQCQNERSQHKNKATAMKMLKAKLYTLRLEEQQSKKKEIESTKQEIGFGSQIRSYVFHPYNMVKDHRTGTETGNVQAVMDGKIDEFIKSYLLSKAGKN